MGKWSRAVEPNYISLFAILCYQAIILFYIIRIGCKQMFSVYKAHRTFNPPAPSHFVGVKKVFFFRGFNLKKYFHTLKFFFRMVLFTKSF